MSDSLQEKRFSWPLAILGVFIGAGAGVVGALPESSPWWWLGVPLGFVIAFLSILTPTSLRK